MGRGEYLRALLVVGVDTKFIEQHGYLLEAILDVLHEGAISAAGGLSSWLACLKSRVIGYWCDLYALSPWRRWRGCRFYASQRRRYGTCLCQHTIF